MTILQQIALFVLRRTDWHPENGLPENLFLFISGLIPIPNVDLMVVNQKGQILLSRRNDLYYGDGWHIPGGCMRFGEDTWQCIQHTALRELGTSVEADPKPVEVIDIMRGKNHRQKYPNERGQNISVLYRCTAPDGWMPDNGNLGEADAGYLKWFDRLPADFLEIQRVYHTVCDQWGPPI